MRFLADANIAARVVAWLREGGHDVWHGPEAGLERLSDAELFERAAARMGAIVCGRCRSGGRDGPLRGAAPAAAAASAST